MSIHQKTYLKHSWTALNQAVTASMRTVSVCVASNTAAGVSVSSHDATERDTKTTNS